MTATDGEFAFEQVEAGLYYVIADLPGYLTPDWQFTEEEARQPTTEVLDLIDKTFPKIQVEHGGTAEINIQLQRGAVLNGSVQYDDGSPAVGIPIQLLRFDKDAKKNADGSVAFRPIPFDSKTDDLGRFRIAGLPALSVIVKSTLRQVRWRMPQLPQRGILEPATSEGYIEHDFTKEQTLDIYSGGVFREKDATLIKLAAGAEVSAGDIVIPLDKIYRVSGVLTSTEDSHALNDGMVELLTTDGLKVSDSKVAFDGSFHFALVPKGEYQLSARGSDSVFLDRFGGSQSSIGAHYYEPSTQPLSIVDHDIDNVVVQLKPKASDSQ